MRMRVTSPSSCCSAAVFDSRRRPWSQVRYPVPPQASTTTVVSSRLAMGERGGAGRRHRGGEARSWRRGRKDRGGVGHGSRERLAAVRRRRHRLFDLERPIVPKCTFPRCERLRTLARASALAAPARRTAHAVARHSGNDVLARPWAWKLSARRLRRLLAGACFSRVPSLQPLLRYGFLAHPRIPSPAAASPLSRLLNQVPPTPLSIRGRHVRSSFAQHRASRCSGRPCGMLWRQ